MNSKARMIPGFTILLALTMMIALACTFEFDPPATSPSTTTAAAGLVPTEASIPTATAVVQEIVCPNNQRVELSVLVEPLDHDFGVLAIQGGGGLVGENE